MFLKFNQNSRFNRSELSNELDSMRILIRDELRIKMSYAGFIMRGSAGYLLLIIEGRIEEIKGMVDRVEAGSTTSLIGQTQRTMEP